MRSVDDETRAVVRNARLDALEADNYGEDEAWGGGDGDAADGDDLYVDDDEEAGQKKSKTAKQGKAKAARAASSAPYVLRLSIYLLLADGFRIGAERRDAGRSRASRSSCTKSWARGSERRRPTTSQLRLRRPRPTPRASSASSAGSLPRTSAAAAARASVASSAAIPTKKAAA
jgi:hypothetical protein